MARITIELNTADMDDYDVAILGAISGREIVVTDAREPEPAEARPQAEAPKKRGRPPKAEPTAVQQAAEQLARENPVSGSLDPTDDGGPSDLEAALLGEDDEPVTATQVTAAMQAHITKHGADKTMAVLVEHGGGAKSFKQIDAAFYGAVHAALQADLA